MALHRRHIWIYLAGILLVSGLGIALTMLAGGKVVSASYDFPFLFQSSEDRQSVIITIDAQTKKNLDQPTDVPLNRRFYTKLIQRLQADGARMALFDLTSFDESHSDAAVDREFAAAARDFGSVVLVTRVATGDQLGVAGEETLIPIVPEIRNAIAAWGLANADADRDEMIRRIYGGTADIPTASWAAARLLGAKATEKDSDRFRERWLNYYGPPGSLRRVFIDHALADDGLPKGFFKDKLVFIGFGSDIGPAGAAQDTFPNPY